MITEITDRQPHTLCINHTHTHRYKATKAQQPPLLSIPPFIHLRPAFFHAHQISHTNTPPLGPNPLSLLLFYFSELARQEASFSAHRHTSTPAPSATSSSSLFSRVCVPSVFGLCVRVCFFWDCFFLLCVYVCVCVNYMHTQQKSFSLLLSPSLSHLHTPSSLCICLCGCWCLSLSAASASPK